MRATLTRAVSTVCCEFNEDNLGIFQFSTSAAVSDFTSRSKFDFRPQYMVLQE